MPPTPRWTRPAGAATWFLTVAVRFSADHRHQLFPSELFADIVRQGGGYPSVPAEVVATVMVLQAPEGLSDREAISALRRDIVWEVACGLRLDDEGFHPTVLVYWRNRIRTSPPATADLAGGPPGGGANRGAVRAALAGAGLHRLGGRGRHPGHRHPGNRRNPSGPPAGGCGPRDGNTIILVDGARAKYAESPVEWTG